MSSFKPSQNPSIVTLRAEHEKALNCYVAEARTLKHPNYQLPTLPLSVWVADAVLMNEHNSGVATRSLDEAKRLQASYQKVFTTNEHYDAFLDDSKNTIVSHITTTTQAQKILEHELKLILNDLKSFVKEEDIVKLVQSVYRPQPVPRRRPLTEVQNPAAHQPSNNTANNGRSIIQPKSALKKQKIINKSVPADTNKDASISLPPPPKRVAISPVLNNNGTLVQAEPAHKISPPTSLAPISVSRVVVDKPHRPTPKEDESAEALAVSQSSLNVATLCLVCARELDFAVTADFASSICSVASLDNLKGYPKLDDNQDILTFANDFNHLPNKPTQTYSVTYMKMMYCLVQTQRSNEKTILTNILANQIPWVQAHLPNIISNNHIHLLLPILTDLLGNIQLDGIPRANYFVLVCNFEALNLNSKLWRRVLYHQPKFATIFSTWDVLSILAFIWYLSVGPVEIVASLKLSDDEKECSTLKQLVMAVKAASPTTFFSLLRLPAIKAFIRGSSFRILHIKQGTNEIFLLHGHDEKSGCCPAEYIWTKSGGGVVMSEQGVKLDLTMDEEGHPQIFMTAIYKKVLPRFRVMDADDESLGYLLDYHYDEVSCVEDMLSKSMGEAEDSDDVL